MEVKQFNQNTGERISHPFIQKFTRVDFENGMLRTEVFTLKKHYFNINSHYGQTDEQSLAASKKKPISSGGGGSSYYKVKKGDTLEKIAKKNGTTVDKICRLNGIKKSKTLKIGQKLRVR